MSWHSIALFAWLVVVSLIATVHLRHGREGHSVVIVLLAILSLLVWRELRP